jgi:hypothetical protein
MFTEAELRFYGRVFNPESVEIVSGSSERGGDVDGTSSDTGFNGVEVLTKRAESDFATQVRGFPIGQKLGGIACNKRGQSVVTGTGQNK